VLFVNVGKPLGVKTPIENIARRIGWNYPEGIRVIAEYWTQNPEATVISIFEADSVGPITAVNAEWGDVFAWTTSPALTAEEGIAMFKSMTEKRAAVT
jgi:hypothetical protein